ncbi:MAG TPA: hypothetical protein VF158_02830 [Longimicrobiales bacterium]
MHTLPRSTRLIPVFALLSAACLDTSTPTRPDGVCWADFMQVDGIIYIGIDLTDGRALRDEDLGEPYDTIAFRLYENVNDPEYEVNDGDAAFLEPGTPIHRVVGYAPEFRLAAKTASGIYLYEADTNPAATLGSDLLDLDGAVDSIGVYSTGMPMYQLGMIEDGATVENLVGMVLDAGVFPPEPVGGDEYFIAFYLKDGTTTVRPYWPDADRLGASLILPDAFGDAVLDAVGRGPAHPNRRLRSIGRYCQP